MKYITIFCLLSNVCFSQASTFDSIYLNRAFEMVNLTNDQKSQIVNKFNELRATAQFKVSGEAQLYALNKVNIYAHDILSDDQKVVFDSTWKDQTLWIIYSSYHHLNLTEAQKEKIISTMESTPGFDSLQIIRFSPDIPVDTMMSLLDSTQLAAEAAHQRQIRLNFENAMAKGDSDRLADATFEKKRVQLILKYYTKHLQHEHKSIISELQERNIEDARRVVEISELYQKRVNTDKIQEIRKCYTSDSVLIAPINKELLEYRYERFALLPNLCIYYCRFGAARTPEIIAEEKQIMSDLESIKQNYPDIINTSILRLKKHKTKLVHKIEQARPSPKSGGSVTIVSDQRTQTLEHIAELLLTQ